jgi:hypothetical protein
MIFIWGKKVVRRKVGFVADFCPMCRDPRPFRLNEVRRIGHIYYISLGSGDLLGYERVCEGCTLALHGEPGHYASTLKKVASVDLLMQSTYPNLRDVYAERLRIEETVRHSPGELSMDVREALIKQPFVLLSSVVEAKLRQSSMDLVSGGILIASLVAFCASLVVAPSIAPDHVPELVTAVGLVCLAAIVWAFATGAKRYVRAAILPRIAKTLRPLRPSDGEIGAVLAEMRRARHKLAGKLQSQDVLRAIREG